MEKKEPVKQRIKTKYICIAGDSQGVGKSSTCLGIVGNLIKSGLYDPDDIAYIKPATQCVKTQLISKYSEKYGVKHRGLGPVIFKKGYTYKCIDQTDGTDEDRMQRILEAIEQVSKNKKLVVIDGVGYCAVGSCAGVSNAQIAQRLNAPVLLVSKFGVGNCIDSINQNLAYYAMYGVKVLGVIVNEGMQKQQHSLENVSKYVKMFFERNNPDLKIFGFVTIYQELADYYEGSEETCQVFVKVGDEEKDLVMKEVEHILAQTFIDHFGSFVEIRDINQEITDFYNNNTNDSNLVNSYQENLKSKKHQMKLQQTPKQFEGQQQQSKQQQQNQQEEDKEKDVLEINLSKVFFFSAFAFLGINHIYTRFFMKKD